MEKKKGTVIIIVSNTNVTFELCKLWLLLECEKHLLKCVEGEEEVEEEEEEEEEEEDDDDHDDDDYFGVSICSIVIGRLYLVEPFLLLWPACGLLLGPTGRPVQWPL